MTSLLQSIGPFLIAISFSMFFTCLIVAWLKSERKDIPLKLSYAFVSGVILGLVITTFMGFAPWQEIKGFDYSRIEDFSSTSPQIAAMTERAFADGKISNLEYHQIENASEGLENDNYLERSRASAFNAVTKYGEGK